MFSIIQTRKIIDLGPPLQISACMAGPLLKRLQIWLKRLVKNLVHFVLQGEGGRS